jgi:hypothetical protein
MRKFKAVTTQKLTTFFCVPIGPIALFNTGIKAQVLDFRSSTKYTLFERGLGSYWCT